MIDETARREVGVSLSIRQPVGFGVIGTVEDFALRVHAWIIASCQG